MNYTGVGAILIGVAISVWGGWNFGRHNGKREARKAAGWAVFGIVVAVIGWVILYTH